MPRGQRVGCGAVKLPEGVKVFILNTFSFINWMRSAVHKPRESVSVRLDLGRASGVRLFNHKTLYLVWQLATWHATYSNYCGSWSNI